MQAQGKPHAGSITAGKTARCRGKRFTLRLPSARRCKPLRDPQPRCRKPGQPGSLPPAKAAKGGSPSSGTPRHGPAHPNRLPALSLPRPGAYPGRPAAVEPGRAADSRRAPVRRRHRAAIAAAPAIAPAGPPTMPSAADGGPRGRRKEGGEGSALCQDGARLASPPPRRAAAPPAPPPCQFQLWRP